MSIRFRTHGLVTVLLAIGLFGLQADAQTIVTGDVVGTVVDPSNAVVPNATVTLTSDAMGVSETTKTTGTGLYRFPLLKPGHYKVIIAQSGFRTANQNVIVEIGSVTTANIQLQVGQGSEVVEVTETTPLVQTENANLTTNLSQKIVDSMPNGGNDMTYVAQVAPGVTMNTSSGNGYGNFVAFGLPATSNLFTVNGNDEMDPYLNLNNSGAAHLLL